MRFREPRQITACKVLIQRVTLAGLSGFEKELWLEGVSPASQAAAETTVAIY
jgi:hypothetical protein